MKITRLFLTLSTCLLLLLGSASNIFAGNSAADPTTGTNLIANASAETATGSAPTDWSKDNWGTNTPTFTYLNTGHTGSHSLEVSLSSYSSGDAKWYFDPINVPGSTNYTFSDYYESNISSDVVVQFQDTSGNYTYEDLGSAQPATTWTAYTASFITPANVSNVTVFHLINAVGNLTIDDASLTATPAPVVTAPTPGTNIIANPSVETANGSAPANWSEDNWGTNTPTFSYLNTGHTGSHSLKVSISSYSSGDAKWYFNPINVPGSTSYDFSDYYESNISSDVVVQFQDTSGNYTYEDLGSAKAASTWTEYTGSFTTPANVSNVTVFHLINAVGNLTIDDASLMAGSSTTTTPPPVTTTGTNLFANPSVETTDSTGTQPANWYQGQWGDNTTSFSYLNTGHTGSHSLRIDMSDFSDGGADWSSDSENVTAGAVYAFSDYYQSNTASQAMVAVQMSDGTTQYIWLGNPYTSDGTWTRFYAQFTMPTGAVSATAYQSIGGNGYLTTDDYDLEPYVPAPFSKAMVSVTFDDSIASQYTNGYPVLKSDNIKGTFYVISGDVGICNPDISSICYMTSAQVKALYKAGEEIGSHTVDHPDLTTLTTPAVDTELSQAQTSLESMTGAKTITDFAAPYGDVNLSVLNEVSKYYQSQRGVEIGYNDKNNYNQQDLLVQDVDSDTTVAQVESYIAYAKSTKTYLVLVYHDIDTDATIDPGYNTTPADFKTEMKYLKSSGVATETMAQAITAIAPQLK